MIDTDYIPCDVVAAAAPLGDGIGAPTTVTADGVDNDIPTTPVGDVDDDDTPTGTVADGDDDDDIPTGTFTDDNDEGTGDLRTSDSFAAIESLSCTLSLSTSCLEMLSS